MLRLPNNHFINLCLVLMNEAPKSKTPPLIFNELLNRCLGETEFACRILRDFVETSITLLDEIKSSVVDLDPVELARKVHRLKGTAATVGAQPFKDSLVEFESILRGDHGHDETPGISDALKTCLEKFDSVQSFIENELLPHPNA